MPGGMLKRKSCRSRSLFSIFSTEGVLLISLQRDHYLMVPSCMSIDRLFLSCFL